MNVLWKLVKVAVGLAIAIPLGILALALTLGILGAIVGVAVFALKLAVVGFIGYGVYRFARSLFGSPAKPAAPRPVRELSAARDPYYDAAMREIDAEMLVNR